jgi:transposase
MHMASVGIDLGKTTFHLVALGEHNKVLLRKKFSRPQLLAYTATVAAIGNGAAFRRGRDFAAWVGVVPRQYSTGGKQRLFGISKRGNIYLRRMLIHGARAVLLRVKYDTGGFGQWVHRLAQRAPRNKVVVAIANKLARMAWAVLSSGKEYRHQPLQPAAA